MDIIFQFPLQIINQRDNSYSYWQITTIEMIFDFTPNESLSKPTKLFKLIKNYKKNIFLNSELYYFLY